MYSITLTSVSFSADSVPGFWVCSIAKEEVGALLLGETRVALTIHTP